MTLLSGYVIQIGWSDLAISCGIGVKWIKYMKDTMRNLSAMSFFLMRSYYSTSDPYFLRPTWHRHHRCRDMETLSTLLALCEENTPVTGGFPPQRASNAEFWNKREIKFIGLFGDRGHRGSYSPYKPCNHNLYIGTIIFPHIDNPQSTGYG